MHEPPYRIKNMVPGMIMLWKGAVVDIPSGWHECDGTVGTPDLRGLFVRAASPGNPPLSTGGSSTHTHPFTGDGHSHGPTAGIDFSSASPVDLAIAPNSAVGTTDSASHRPPYMNLCYIMKL